MLPQRRPRRLVDALPLHLSPDVLAFELHESLQRLALGQGERRMPEVNEQDIARTSPCKMGQGVVAVR